MSTITPSVCIGRPSCVAHDRVALPHPLDRAVGRDHAVLAVVLDLVLKVRISSISTSSRSSGCRRSAHSSGSATQRSAGSRAAARSAARRTRTATLAPTGRRMTPPAPVPPGSDSGDRRVRAPPGFAPRRSLTGSRVTPPALTTTSRTPWEMCSCSSVRVKWAIRRRTATFSPPWWRKSAGFRQTGRRSPARVRAASRDRVPATDRPRRSRTRRCRGVREAHAAGDRDDRLRVVGEHRDERDVVVRRRPRSGSAARRRVRRGLAARKRLHGSSRG